MTFLVLVIVASTLFVVAANAVSSTGIRTPVNTGFAGQGQFRQGMQTGNPAQGQAGGIVAPQTNFQAQAGIGQQRGAGIVAGDQPGTGPLNPAGSPGSTGTVGGGGPGSCYCITAPCNCGGTSGGTGPIVTGGAGTGTIGSGPIVTANQVPQTTAPLQTMNQQVQTQQFPAQQFQQPLQTQTFQGQGIQSLTAPAGGIQPRQF